MTPANQQYLTVAKCLGAYRAYIQKYSRGIIPVVTELPFHTPLKIKIKETGRDLSVSGLFASRRDRHCVLRSITVTIAFCFFKARMQHNAPGIIFFMLKMTKEKGGKGKKRKKGKKGKKKKVIGDHLVVELTGTILSAISFLMPGSPGIL